MPIVSDISTLVLSVKDVLGFFTIPVAIAAVILLFIVAKYSYDMLGVLIPLAGATAGAYVSMELLGSVVGKYIPDVSKYVNIEYLIGIVIAIILAFVCAKYYNFTLFLIGGAVGYVFISRMVKDVLIPLDIVQQTVKSAGATVTSVVGILISVACGLVLAIVVMKYFKQIFTMLTSVACVAGGAAIGAIFMFANASISDYAVIGFAILGTLIGIRLAIEQLIFNWYRL